MKKLNVSQMENLQGGANHCFRNGVKSILAAGVGALAGPIGAAAAFLSVVDADCL